MREGTGAVEAEPDRHADGLLSALQLPLRGAQHDHHEDRRHNHHLRAGAALHLHGLPALSGPAHERQAQAEPGLSATEERRAEHGRWRGKCSLD